MIDLYSVATKQLLGSITESDLQVLVDALAARGESLHGLLAARR